MLRAETRYQEGRPARLRNQVKHKNGVCFGVWGFPPPKDGRSEWERA